MNLGEENKIEMQIDTNCLIFIQYIFSNHETTFYNFRQKALLKFTRYSRRNENRYNFENFFLS